MMSLFTIIGDIFTIFRCHTIIQHQWMAVASKKIAWPLIVNRPPGGQFGPSGGPSGAQNLGSSYVSLYQFLQLKCQPSEQQNSHKTKYRLLITYIAYFYASAPLDMFVVKLVT